MQQCREGWHLDKDPEPPADADNQDPEGDDDPEGERDDDEDGAQSRRKRSTKRRQDAPDLPRRPVEATTVGKAFVTPSGKTYRPSMFLTLTLPSYGLVTRDGTPRADYDYRRAALDALHFPKLIDRFWQNLRRAAGYQVQYFAVVEEQLRLAPHLHAAVRGAIPRALVREVAAATYHQVWWPRHDERIYGPENLPEWQDGVGYVDPDTGRALPTWQEALDAIDDDPDAQPAHVVRFGKQLDMQGIIATEGDADRRVAYLTKYLTKAIAATHGKPEELTRAQRRHMRKLHEQVEVLPCSPRCWNWLFYGAQPLDAAAGMVPGQCPSKAHDFENLGCGGRRVLVSRKWTGKTLKVHKADRAAVVRQVLEAAGVAVPETNRMAADIRREDGVPRFSWSVWDPIDASVSVYRQVMTKSIAERVRWKTEYELAKQRASPTGAATANGPPAAPTPLPG